MYEGNHPEVATSIYNMGEAYYNLAKYDAALQYYKQALAMR